MSWVFLLKAALKFGSLIARIVQQKQLMDAGEAKAVSKGLQDATEKMDKANQAIRDVRRDSRVRLLLRRKYRAAKD
ncbi:MAG: hypothetical protein CMO16_02920 [Thaumarchaeota archaeon]|nr:hypothetical protein [Nitrososphaerota archaeon]|tara:strand:- start:51 stop:278 length:228 start_codon:yes stop_codon:yes gene_type:complete